MAKASIIWPSVVSVGVFFFMRSMVTLSAMTFLITPQTQVAAVSVLLLERLGEQFLPLLDRANKMMVRNLKTLKELRQGATPTVAIGRAEQVNVAERQAKA